MSAPGAAMPVDEARLLDWRRDTPGVAHRVHLNNAGSSLPPAPVTAAVEEHLRREAEIGGYEAAEEAAEAIATAYEEVAALTGAAPRRVAIASSATAAFVRALQAFDFEPGDVIVTSRCDYNSNQIQYLSLAARRGVRIARAADLPEGGVDPDSVRVLCRDRRCRLVALSWVPTNSGLVQDVHAVGEVCRDAGVPYLVDACQAVGQIPIDVDALGCDYLSATARKFLRGPRGIGFLIVSERALRRGDHPLLLDMRGATWTEADALALADSALRFEEWEQSWALVRGLGAAARYARAVGLETAQARAWSLAATAREGLAAIPGVRVLDRGRSLCAIVTFTVAGRAPERVKQELSGRRISVTVSPRSSGVIDFDDKGVEGAVRASPHYYNADAEVEALLEAVREIAAI